MNALLPMRTLAAALACVALVASPRLARAEGDAPSPDSSVVAAAAADSATTPDDANAAAGTTADSASGAAPDSAASAAGAAPAAPLPMNAQLRVVSRRVELVGEARNVVRSGPGESFALVGVFPKGSEFTVIARSGDWYGVKLSPTETGWVHRSLCKEKDDFSDLQFKPNPKLFTRTGTFILSGYGGGYAFDRKSNSFVLGGKLGYYVFDRIQVEGGASWTHVHRPAEIVESLFGLTLEAEDFHMLFYHLNANLELLPGRQMVPYVSAGVGSSIMKGESEPSFNYGAGTTLFLSRRTAVRWEVRDYRFAIGSQNARSKNDNIEFTIGSLVLF